MSGVDTHLRRAQVVFHILVVCGGLMACISLGWDVRIFGDNCILYSHMGVQTRLMTFLDISLTEWGPISICYYCIFSSVMGIIYAIIWFWFYILLSKWETTADATEQVVNIQQGDYRPPPDVRILLPTMFSSAILMLCQLVNLGFIMVGGQQWCDSLKKSNVHCSDLQDLDWRFDYEDVDLSYIYLQVAQAGSWTLLLSVVGITVIVGCRLHLHFTSSVFKEPLLTSKVDGLFRNTARQGEAANINKSFSFDKTTGTESDCEDSQTGESSKLQKGRKQYYTI